MKALCVLLVCGAALAQDDPIAHAQKLQREQGYQAALDYLEPQLAHEDVAQRPALVMLYADVCAWSGNEERGLEHLRKAPVPAKARIKGELYLLSVLQRYDEVAKRAREVMGDDPKWAEYVAWSEEEAARRRRLRERAKRGVHVAIGAILVVLAGVAALFRLAPRVP